MKRAISELKKVVRQLTEKLSPFQKAVENCIEENDFEGAKKAIEAKKIEQVKIDNLKAVIADLEKELAAEEVGEKSIRQLTGGIDEKGKTPNVPPAAATPAK